jgi:hypothetical protein
VGEVQEGHIGGVSETADGVVVDNRTGLPDDQVMAAVYSHWVESAAFQFGQPSTFQLFSNTQGSLLARTPFQVPKDVIEEIKLARTVAETDDDVQAAISQQIAAAYRDGMQHQHTDEQTQGFFNAWAEDQNLDGLMKEMHREFLISSQVTTLALFVRKRLSFIPDDTSTEVTGQLAVPMIGVLPAENVRVTSTDLFGNGSLAYEVHNEQMKRWLDEFFSPRTTPARKSQMREQEPVMAAVFTGREEIPWNDPDMTIAGKVLYTLNEQMVKRTTMPKGASPYPRPLLTSNFALLEAKRLLNVMDYALLQGGTNYIVVAKVGSDKLPGQQPEVDNLMNQVRVASRSGVLVGDHRVDIEIITPELKELLNPEKRQLVGRKITQALLRIPEQVTGDGGTEGIKAEMTLTENTVTGDRRDMRRHLENGPYRQIVKRNPSRFKKGAPTIWFPRIILTDSKDFYDAVLKTRDRGDIPRKWSVEMLGFNFEAGVEQRKREQAAGLDELMVPGNVPFSDPSQGPQDSNDGRPPGSSPNNGRNGAPAPAGSPRPRRTILRTPGETVRAEWDATEGRTLRVGEVTEALLDQYPGFEVGRVTNYERDALAAARIHQAAAAVVVPVNLGYEVAAIRALRLDDGVSVIVGERTTDKAMVARALCFRERWTVDEAEETARRWGFEPAPREDDEIEEEHASLAVAPNFEEMTTRMVEAVASALQNMPQPTILLTLPGQRPMRVVRDEETGAIIGTEPVPEGE